MYRRDYLLRGWFERARAGVTTPNANAVRRRLLVLLLLAVILRSPLSAQSGPESIGRIEGADIIVKGGIHVRSENGPVVTTLLSGNDVTVRSGDARIELTEGGAISVCAPAHFSLLKSGGDVTLALDYGRVHAQMDSGVSLRIYTAQIVATPLGIGAGPRDSTIGLDASGAMCVLAWRGAVRIEPQLGGQSLLVPQTGEIALAGGQLETVVNGNGNCHCDALYQKTELPRPKPPEFSVPSPAGVARAIKPPEKGKPPSTPEEAKPPAIEAPVYQVFMPPLTFDATSPAPPPDASPETMLLVREVRVRPAAVFTGVVEAAALPGAAALKPTQEEKPAQKNAGFFRWFRHLFRKNPRPACDGAGCS